MLTFLALMACSTTPTPPPEPPAHVADLLLPTAPFEALMVRMSADLPDLAIEVRNAEGEEVEFEDGTRRGAWFSFTPSAPLPEGAYVLETVDDIEVDEAFEVAPYGLDPDPLTLEAGMAWDIDLFSGDDTTGLLPIVVGNFRQTVLFEILEVVDDVVDFRFVAVVEERACVAHTDTLAVDATGGIVRPPTDVDVAAYDAVTTFYDSELSGGFYGDTLGGFGISGLLDLGPWDSTFNGDSCELIGAVGTRCVPCPDGSSEDCLPLDLVGFVAAPTALPYAPGAPLEPCLVEMDPIVCEPVSCTTHGVGAAWLGVPLLAALGLRRRRSAI